MLLQHFYNWHFSSDCNKSRILLLKKIWPVFLIAGLGFLVGAIFTCGLISILFAITGTSSLWAIKELFEQEKRVNKGWFPENDCALLTVLNMVVSTSSTTALQIYWTALSAKTLRTAGFFANRSLRFESFVCKILVDLK